MDENNSPAFSHAQLEFLNIQTDLQIRLVFWKVRSEKDLSSITPSHKLLAEEDVQGSIVLGQQHQVPGILILHVLLSVNSHIVKF